MTKLPALENLAPESAMPKTLASKFATPLGNTTLIGIQVKVGMAGALPVMPCLAAVFSEIPACPELPRSSEIPTRPEIAIGLEISKSPIPVSTHTVAIEP